MDSYKAIGIAEGLEPVESEEEVLEAWQYIYDTNLHHQLQGWFGRTLQMLIDNDLIETRNRDDR